MFIYLLRHADADTPAPTDNARALSEKGVSQAQTVARFCEKHELRPTVIFTSPVRRARETAEIVAARLKIDIEIQRWLACGMQPEEAVKQLGASRAFESLMIVGHEPDFSRLAAHLLGLPTATAIHIRKASLTLLEVHVLKAGGATLDFALPCKLM